MCDPIHDGNNFSREVQKLVIYFFIKLEEMFALNNQLITITLAHLLNPLQIYEDLFLDFHLLDLSDPLFCKLLKKIKEHFFSFLHINIRAPKSSPHHFILHLVILVYLTHVAIWWLLLTPLITTNIQSLSLIILVQKSSFLDSTILTIFFATWFTIWS